MRYFLILLLLLCSSCIQLFDDPQPVRYYLFESLPEGAEIYSSKTLAIDLQLIHFPTYIDRPQVIVRNNDNTIKFSDLDRWAEPLRENILQTLRENLRVILPGAEVSISPWEDSTTNTIKTEIMVNKFSGKLGDHTDIDIGWIIETVDGEIHQGHLTDQQPIGDTYQELVTGLNIGINNFSQQLAKDLARE
jgi:uncharacterized lipoprotein YmbA